MALYIVTVAPSPRASTRMATIVIHGERRSARNPNRTSARTAFTNWPRRPKEWCSVIPRPCLGAVARQLGLGDKPGAALDILPQAYDGPGRRSTPPTTA